jgi:predicted nucleic acid-binding protein
MRSRQPERQGEPMQFMDANVFLRFLTRDDPVKAERVKALLERARDGEVALVTSESVITELVFVLSSPKLYRLSRQDVRFAAVFARRDWEHAVGAHYMVNFIPWVMAFLQRGALH